jgi:hypothetical protein
MRFLPWALVLVSCTAQPRGPVTYSRDIAPLLNANCVTCHRPGQIAPFSLTHYEDAKKRARTLAYATRTRRMPPWKAEPGFGEFEDERRLTDGQIELIQQWVEQGAPQGDPADLPPTPSFPDGWTLGEPDLVVRMPEPFMVPAEGRDIYQCFVLPLNLPQETFVRAAVFRPSNLKVVHHALLFLDSTGMARRLDAKTPEPGYPHVGGPGFMPTGTLDGWAPGAVARPLPDGIGWRVRKGSDLVVQTHFHPTGKVEQEQSSVGLYFCKHPPERLTFTLPVLNRALDIPAGQADYTLCASFTFPAEVEVIGVIPHAHLLCREMKATVTPPGGAAQGMIWIKDWDFNWQDHYRYKQRLHLARGTRIDLEYTYDNSEANPRNPNRPPKEVKWGEQTTDEMCILFVQFVPVRNSDMPALGAALLGQAAELFRSNR